MNIGSKLAWTLAASLFWACAPASADSVDLSGISSFSGQLGPDHVVRGSWTFTGRPGVSGQFTAQTP
ncbi:MAG: hypothetical protein ACLPSW_28000 [Roseiarcus sp.]